MHSCLSKSAQLRPDVISLMRSAFLSRHAAKPTDLRPYLSSIAPTLVAAHPLNSDGSIGGGFIQSVFDMVASDERCNDGPSSNIITGRLVADEVLSDSLMSLDGP